jgi:IPT/TIG domain
MHAIRLTLLLLVAASAAASPVITSVTPSEGPVFGGTRVMIKGTGFSDVCIVCSPPFGGLQVLFGTTPALDADLVEGGIEAIAPPHLPGTVDVTVTQIDGSDPSFDIAENAYTYIGEAQAGFDAVLFPIFMPPTPGAFESMFVTTARVASRGEPIDVLGFDTTCTTIDPPLIPGSPIRIGSGNHELYTACSQSVGRFFFVPRGRSDDFVANLRVTDMTRAAQSHGVEIPVVRESQFHPGKIMLLGVPIEARYRNTLRIYGLPGGSQFVNVTINGVTRGVPLHRGADAFEPSYAQFSDFPVPGPGVPPVVSVIVEPPSQGIVPPTRVWAFVSVTNNETQAITTVTPN